MVQRWFLPLKNIDFGTKWATTFLPSGNFSPMENWKEQEKKPKHMQEFVPTQNKKTWDVFEYCIGFLILLHWLLMKGQAKRGFSFPKSLKKCCLSLSPELKALNIVGYCTVLAAIEVVNLLRISSFIIGRKKNSFGSSSSWGTNAVLLEVQGLLTGISCHTQTPAKKYTCTDQVRTKTWTAIIS